MAETTELFGPASFRWWIGGGHALELFAGRSWRSHSDIDVGVCRGDAPAVADLLAGWDVHVAASGQLTPWRGEPLDAGRSRNNVWCRRTPSSPWCLDVTVGEGDATHWISRRNPALRRRWEDAVLRTALGVPYLAPEIQLLFKSRDVRPKDSEDARQVVGLLTPEQRDRLNRWLPGGHPWRALLAD